ncbi:phosphoenolpyruvate synthase [Pseudonocardia ailaonensis]|uniref:phosphoenolpyruvate synthase n=1 Tax=Pseudonocardia ailaonensis TaxID=367279 RepID=UPI0031D36F81
MVGLGEITTGIGNTQVGEVGGKAANLGELTRVEGVRVPPGFVVTAGAFRRVVVPVLDGVLGRLSGLRPEDRAGIATGSAEVRAAIEAIPLPADLAAEVAAHVGSRFRPGTAYAVRSSATAEDLPTASFAGQQDSYLDVVGVEAVLDHVRRCWASLFTERAVSYRIHNGFDHRRVHMAVVVQEMVAADAAGILFTADPVSGNRTVATVDAVRGLGEALVSGTVNGDGYAVREGVVSRTAGAGQPILADEEVLRLVRLGRLIEAHFGRPQDIEWCLAGGALSVVQSRPITTLFPVPEAGDGQKHVYVSVGHQQMMTDAMTPLGLSFWQRTTPRPMAEAGCRLFVDVAGRLVDPASREALVGGFEMADPLTGYALRAAVDSGFLGDLSGAAPAPAPAPVAPIEADPALVEDLIAESRASLDAVTRDIAPLSGPALFDFLLTDIEELRRLLFEPRSLPAIMSGMEAAQWLNRHVEEWLGERNVADTLSQSVPHNVTSEMGIALLDVADVMRPEPSVVAVLREVEQKGSDDLLAALDAVHPPSAGALRAFLDRYGMRCAGEIDITRTRWSEDPTLLVSALLGNIRNEAGAGARLFERGLRQAQEKEADVLRRLRALPDGEAKATETKAMIDRVRVFAGYREYPKYGMIRRYFVYKQALLREAARQVDAGVLARVDDIFYLRFEEFRAAVGSGVADPELIARRRQEFEDARRLTPPRVFTSDGEIMSGGYRRDDVPEGALAGLAVSVGTVEGRARVVLDMADADLDAGDILVTAYTDPSWTPLFVGITGLVTEVGGLMTHGAVIAREYGLPAVVGVEGATRLIPDGARIRVHGTEGYVEILS